MNFLGHWLFSDPDADSLLGSLWPDFALRPDPNAVSPLFIQHFDRHQWLDRTTDASPELEPLRQRLRPKLRKTTPIVIDMLLDHHLALHWSRYHPQALDAFTQQRYRETHRFNALPLPERLQRTLHWLIEDDWLGGYRRPENVVRALGGLSRRLKFADEMEAQGFWAIAQLQLEEVAVAAFLRRVMTEVGGNPGSRPG
ncbi:ACP phosphodiesterase [Saccharospirillum mangrovi]|uniref:acyl carrier protein phosphodiesterase n=1 Tax=Saccharospirillum mangrovi TaxID=2161747 RepID=UPI000D361C62|nr:acyl carrier protein phosphodiesterase [Saccharospirillum mangrovi]